MASHNWKLQFRAHCMEERDRYLELAKMLEDGVFQLYENHVDISAQWAERDRRIAGELDGLIAKIDEDIGTREDPESSSAPSIRTKPRTTATNA